MTTLFVLLFGMLVAGAGVALGIVAWDRSREPAVQPVRCSPED